ncbi:hypothetical protein HANVADRAFT_99027 [Hanseniaspora valbyensis NRRL Y-1626]|uniref:Uncharacterized protein n=1 Tax=Hanseniaspora valbyensis NRRL Y-1626 TaxID=766949 RepID=A0A1B7THT4_9ASCO|nr:hypothetical protein HANVADRAFT_99027 [Hanseniaspora valbyensis NRRL Y-1626]
MDYKFQYTVIKKLVSFYNTTPANRSSLVQDILNNKDLNLFNNVFISTFNSKVDPNNTVNSIFDLVDLGIFDGISYNTKDWVNIINLVNFFNDNIFTLCEANDIEYITINNVVMNSKNNDLANDYDSISRSQRILSKNKNDLIEKYELLHEFIFLSFTISCYKNFLLLDNSNYKEFENLLELNLFKWTSSFNSEVNDIDSLLDLQEQCKKLEQEGLKKNINSNMNNEFGSNGVLNNSDLVVEKNRFINELSNILNEVESKERMQEKLENKFKILLRQYSTIIENLPIIEKGVDEDKLYQLLSNIPHDIKMDTTLDYLKELKLVLTEVSFLLNNNTVAKQDYTTKINELNNLLANQTNIIKSLKQIQNEKLTKENKQQMIKQSHNLEIDSYKQNILREYKVVQVLEKELISSVAAMYNNILKIDLKKYTPKFEEIENEIRSMDSELNERF